MRDGYRCEDCADKSERCEVCKARKTARRAELRAERRKAHACIDCGGKVAKVKGVELTRCRKHATDATRRAAASKRTTSEVVREMAERIKRLEAAALKPRAADPKRQGAAVAVAKPAAVATPAGDTLSVQNAATLCNVSKRAVLNWVQDGKLTATRVGHTFLLDGDAVRALVEQRTRDGARGLKASNGVHA